MGYVYGVVDRPQKQATLLAAAIADSNESAMGFLVAAISRCPGSTVCSWTRSLRWVTLETPKPSSLEPLLIFNAYHAAALVQQFILFEAGVSAGNEFDDSFI